MDYFRLLVLTQLCITLFLTGLIWVIQRVHYPLMRFVASPEFSEFEKLHCKRIGQIVAPFMIAEGMLGLALWWLSRTVFENALCSVGLLLTATIWLCTFTIQMPIHRRLEDGRDETSIEKLVRTNWFRTLAWSLRAIVAFALAV